MDFYEFVKRFRPPYYVWQMTQGDRRPGASKRRENAERKIKELIRDYALELDRQAAEELY